MVLVFFFSSRRRHTRCSRDWSSDVCSSDLLTSKTKARLFADKRVKATAVTVETDERIVTMRGKVRTVEEKLAAEQIARGTDGVRGVNNVLQVVPEGQWRLVDARDGDIKQSVKNRLETDAMLRDAD